jgi:rare lipoprotein A
MQDLLNRAAPPPSHANNVSQPGARLARLAIAGGIAIVAANCSQGPQRPERQLSAQQQREIGAFSDTAKYGRASPRVVQYGDAVPKGGGRYHVGPSYRIAGRIYSPRENPNYTAVGNASWYGAAFHGRKTANGEIYDKYSFTAAHPTMPLPSYARVTNLGNNRSMIVRVNDRGPFHGGRIIDLSQQVADALQFRHLGTARVRVDYVGRAGLAGSDDRKLMATLRTDGQPADAPAGLGSGVMVASADQNFQSQTRTAAVLAPEAPVPLPRRAEPARVQVASLASAAGETQPEAASVQRAAGVARAGVPVPPARPFEVGAVSTRSAPVATVAAAPAQPRTTVASAVPAVAPAAFAPPTARAAVAPLNAALQPVPVARALASVPAQPIQQAAALYYADAVSPQPLVAQAFRFVRNDGVEPLARAASPAAVQVPAAAVALIVEAGVFRDAGNAERLARRLAGPGSVSVQPLTLAGGTMYRVSVSGLASEESARQVAEVARQAGAAGARVLRR